MSLTIFLGSNHAISNVHACTHTFCISLTHETLLVSHTHHESRFLPGWDIVVVARGRAVDASFSDLTRAYLSLAKKSGILREEQP